jgi:hypothetical protein
MEDKTDPENIRTLVLDTGLDPYRGLIQISQRQMRLNSIDYNTQCTTYVSMVFCIILTWGIAGRDGLA